MNKDELKEEKSDRLLERETIINYNMAEPNATIYSCQENVWSRCKKLGYKELEDEVRRDKRDKIISRTFECPKKCISFRKAGKTRVGRKLTPEHLASMQRGRKMVKNAILHH
jgi:hypothetical protein